MVEHFLGKEEVPSSILGNSSKQQREGETKVSPFFVMRGVGTCSPTPRITKKEEGDTRGRPFSLVALKAPLRQQQRKGSPNGEPILGNEEGDTRGRPFSLFALKAPLRRQQRTGSPNGEPILGKEEGDTRGRPFSLVALMAPLRQQQRKKPPKRRINPRKQPPRRRTRKGCTLLVDAARTAVLGRKQQKPRPRRSGLFSCHYPYFSNAGKGAI